MMSKPSEHSVRPQQRGIALIGVIGLLLVFLIFAGAMLDQLAYELNSTKMSAASNRALAAADAGVRDAVEQVQTDLALNQGLPSKAFPLTYKFPEPGASPSVVSYSAYVEQSWPSVGSTGGLSYYLIHSTGTYQNGVLSTVTRSVRALVQSQPISSFASFSNFETNQFGNPVWYLSTQHFNGDVYSGGPMRIAYATPAPSPGPTVEPIFLAAVTTPNQPVWNPGSPGGCNGCWSSVIGPNGKFTIDSIPLSLPQPSSNVALASQAWEGDGLNDFSSGTSYPNVNPGVYIDGKQSGGLDAASTTQTTDSTGIFINAANQSATITSTVMGGTDQLQITSSQWAGTYVVNINYANFENSGDCTGTTTVSLVVKGKTVEGPHTFTGTPCGQPGPGVTNPGEGAIFVYGSANLGNAGTPNTKIEGEYTIATPDYSGYNDSINIYDNLTYDAAASVLYDKLGLWSNNVVLSGPSSNTNVQIDAGIIAGYPGEPSNNGTFNNIHCTKTTCGTGTQGTLTILGSLVENARGAVGEVVNGQQIGFRRIVDFDQRFATSPPPFNPSTGNLVVVAWEDLGQ